PGPLAEPLAPAPAPPPPPPPSPAPPQPAAVRPIRVLGAPAELRMDLSVRFELKADRFRNLTCTSIDRQQAISGCRGGFPTVSPVSQYAVRTGGVVGQRLHVDVDFDSRREFDANNNLKIWYQGLEDDVLKRVEAGNVTFRAP